MEKSGSSAAENRHETENKKKEKAGANDEDSTRKDFSDNIELEMFSLSPTEDPSHNAKEISLVDLENFELLELESSNQDLDKNEVLSSVSEPLSPGPADLNEEFKLSESEIGHSFSEPALLHKDSQSEDGIVEEEQDRSKRWMSFKSKSKQKKDPSVKPPKSISWRKLTNAFKRLPTQKREQRRRLEKCTAQLRTARLESSLRATAKHKKTERLRKDLVRQAQQIHKWGLHSVEGPFRLQARLRLSRLALEEEIERMKMKVFQLREEEMTVMMQMVNSLPTEDVIDERFFTPPDELLQENLLIKSLRTRQQYFDNCCLQALGGLRNHVASSGASLDKQGKRLPTPSQRLQSVVEIVQHFALLESQNRRNGQSVKYEDVVSAYRVYRAKKRKLEMAFAQQVEDERLKEGRLLQEWVKMVNSKRSDKTHPEEVIAFSNFYLKLLKECWGLNGSETLEHALEKEEHLAGADAILLKLVQETVFRRVWPLVFGYDRETTSSMDLLWRGKVEAVRKFPLERLDVPGECFPQCFLEEADGGSYQQAPGGAQREEMKDCAKDCSQNDWSREKWPYKSSSWMLSQMSGCLSPSAMVGCMMKTVEILQMEAQEYANSSQMIGADILFPLLAFVTLYADLPNIHQCLTFLSNFGKTDQAGEEVYYTTMLQAAVAFIIKFETPEDNQTALYRRCSSDVLDCCSAASDSSPVFENKLQSNAKISDEDDNKRENIKEKKTETALKAMESLGDWLGQHQAMEETLDVLEEEGWMM